MLKQLLLAAAGVTVLASTAQAQSRWDGADDLAVNPLGCEADAQPTFAAKDYDGGQVAAAPGLAGKEITLVDVPKLIGIGY